MLLVGGFSVMFGPKPPYDQRQQQNASMIETASTVGKVIGALGAILCVVGLIRAAGGGALPRHSGDGPGPEFSKLRNRERRRRTFLTISLAASGRHSRSG